MIGSISTGEAAPAARSNASRPAASNASSELSVWLSSAPSNVTLTLSIGYPASTPVRAAVADSLSAAFRNSLLDHAVGDQVRKLHAFLMLPGMEGLHPQPDLRILRLAPARTAA